MKTILIFAGLNLFYVVITTVKSILTINGSKWAASASGAFTHFVYTYVLIYMQIDGISTFEKACLVGLANFIGIFIVKFIEEKNQKEKLWVYHCTIKNTEAEIKDLHNKLKDFEIKSIYSEVIKDKRYSLQIFSYTKKESTLIKAMLEDYNAKYHIVETK